jgi:hypothetical protein
VCFLTSDDLDFDRVVMSNFDFFFEIFSESKSRVAESRGKSRFDFWGRLISVVCSVISPGENYRTLPRGTFSLFRLFFQISNNFN